MAYETIGTYRVNTKEVLGHGTFGYVYKGQHVKTKTPVAVKRLDLDGSSERYEFVMREVRAYEAVTEHENIVQLIHHERKSGYLWLVMEFCDGGDLDKYMAEREVPFAQRLDLIKQCISAVHHMHTQSPRPVVHRDIKAGNVLVKIVNKKPVLKFCDFGLAKAIAHDVTRPLSTMCGTEYYIAPELFASEIKYGKPVDIFSLGVLFLALLEYSSKEGFKPIKGEVHCNFNYQFI
jgi:serine/threonine protein kinase